MIELAQASGLDRLSPKERDPMRTTTKGVGELILKAASAGARHVILFVGGSATVDCGTGALSMLGVHFLDGRGGHVKPGGEGLERIRHIDANWVLDGLPRITVACDVVTPLIGPRGALMYAPQKGAGATELRHLDAGLRSFAQAVRSSCGRAIAKIPMGGAAGGFSAGFAGILGATLVHGAPYILSLLRFDKKLGHSDIVITGEGHLDEQSFHGKAPYEVAKLARVAGVPIIAMVGRTSRLKSRFFNAILPLTSETEDTLEAIRQTESRLMLCAASLGLALKASR